MAALLLSACGSHDDTPRLPEAKMPTLPPAPTAPPVVDPTALSAPRWDVVAAAGDASRQVADDAVLDFHDRFDAIGQPIERLRLLSADSKRFNADFFLAPSTVGIVHPNEVDNSSPERIRRLPGATDPASPAMVLRRTLELSGKNNGACLAYLVSSNDGNTLKMRDGTVDAEQLDRALAGGCANAPTVVIVSGCSSGDFAAPPMARPNRLILTAAASGRSGFGCGPNVGLTTFDECLLGSLDGAPSWVAIFERARGCVRRREKLVDQTPVEPQISLGALVTDLPGPWEHRTGPNGVVPRIAWRQGIGRFSLDGVPYFPTLRQRNQATLEAYRHAAGPKALALTLAGTVAWANAAGGIETPEDVARLAIERCELQSGGSCILFARGDALAASGPAGYAPIHPPMLQRGGTFDPATVPFIRDDQRGEAIAYGKLSGTKALALSPGNEAIGIGTGATPAAARAAALAKCTVGGNSDCVIFANGNQVMLDGEAKS